MHKEEIMLKHGFFFFASDEPKPEFTRNLGDCVQSQNVPLTLLTIEN